MEKQSNLQNDNNIHLSVIIPAYNEECRIGRTLEAIADFLPRQNYRSEVLIMGDGSTDKTLKIAGFFSNRISNLKIIENKENHGKGYVVRQGMLAAKGKFRVFMDADNATSLDQIDKFLPFFKEGYDVVIGDRDLKESRIKIHQSKIKEFLGNFGNLLVRILAVPDIEDTQCGFKVFSGQAAGKIFSRMTIDRWGFDIESLAIANMLGYKIKTIPVDWVNDPSSKVKLSGYANTLLELFKIKWNLVTNKYK